MTRWFRFYDDAINDPKLLKLTDGTYRVWVGLLCLASKNEGKLPPFDDMALLLRMKAAKLQPELEKLIEAGLLDHGDAGIEPHNWNGRQYKSDVSTERVKRFRNGVKAVTETPPETEQIQTTEQIRKITRATRLPDDWKPSEQDIAFALGKNLSQSRIETEGLKFRNYWTGKGGNAATKTNWPRTWENWILNVIERGGAGVNGTNNLSTNTPAGRANAKESQFLAAVGRGGLAALRKGQSGRSDGEASGNDGATAGHASDWRAENVG